MRRGEIWWVRMPVPSGRRPVVLASRNLAYAVRSKVTVVEVTTRARGLETEVPLGRRDGLPRACCANADNLITIDKSWLEERMGALSADKMKRLDHALALALGLPTKSGDE
ncbi:MAG: type II toxin-antitoxin system PemK/MazF family toxin [Myxococcales bacterium]|nr:type II toxin-antitoxin system PemK/MazF family toxin [Myxococcales bacterium]